MARNDPVTGLENVVQLTKPHRVPLAPSRAVAAPIVPFESWVEQRDAAAAALLSGTRRILVTGPAGTGKTVLVDYIARIMRAAGRTVLIELADTDPVPPPAGTTLFVDEADRLSDAKLRMLQAGAGILILAGLGTLASRVRDAGLHLTLEPLGQEAARAFIAEWLALTSRTTADLDSLAVRPLVELSGGVPRLMSTLLGASAWLAKASGAAVITAAHVQEAAELRSVFPPRPVAAPMERRSGGRAWGSVALAAAVVIGTGVAVAPRLFPDRVGGLVDAVVNLAPVRDFETRMSALAVLWASAVLPSPAPVATGPASVMPSQALPIETIDSLLRRGEEMVRLNDLAAARLLFRRAADAGSGEAMLALGQTYDPAVLISTGSMRLADHEQAKRWYESAAATGNVAATQRLEMK